MPRLSIIIPHRNDDQRLETTLVSVLENRPHDCEIIVVHNGSYSDPYELCDEVVFVEENPQISSVGLLNAGVLAACSPIIHVLLDGVIVSNRWADIALEKLDESGIDALAVRTRTSSWQSSGVLPLTRVSTPTLMRGKVDQAQSASIQAGPTIACGFYRRRQLLALDGWNANLDIATADVELAWSMQTLGLNCECHPDLELQASDEIGRTLCRSSVGQLAELAVAFGISGSGLGAAIGDCAKGLLSGNPSKALSWSKGLLERRLSRQTTKRLAAAKKQLDAIDRADSSIRLFTGSSEPSPARHAA